MQLSMKKVLYIVRPYIVLLLGIAIACSRESDFESGDASRIPICVSGQIDQRATKANALGFVDKDALGLYAVNYLENNTIPGDLLDSGNQADNVKYIFDEGNHKWVPVHSVYYKDVNTNVDLYLYYPYQSGISSVTASGFEVRKDQSSAATPYALSGYEASDYLWGKAANVSPTESATPVLMQHRLSGVQVTLVPKDGFAEGEFESLSKSIILMNTTRKATINYTTGVATAVGRPQVDGIVMCPQEDGTFRAIVIPQTVGAGVRLFSITLGGVVYGFTQGQEVSYQAGKQLNVAIQVTKKTPSGEYELELGETQIVDWTEDRNTHGGEARQYYIVTLDTPGTLGRTIKSAGKNPNKIRNIKVCGPVTDADFYFMRDSMAILEAVNMREAQLKEIGTDFKYDAFIGDNVPRSFQDGAISYKAFYNKKTLTHFVFPNEITEIHVSAFDNSGLADALVIPEGVKRIGGGAFSRTLITSLSLPSDLEFIGDRAFNGCSGISNQLLLPESLKQIEREAFKGCFLACKLTLPTRLEYIGQEAFAYNSFVGGLELPEGLSVIEPSTFAYAGFTGKLIIGEGVTIIRSGAFAGCGFGGELMIPEGISIIPSRAFAENFFSSVVFPSSLRKIDEGAFSGNPYITEPIVVPEGVVSIGPWAFYGCNALPSVEFPSTLQYIGEGAFQSYGTVSDITRIICASLEPPILGDNAFEGVKKNNFTVEVPAPSVKRYQAEQGWSDFTRISAYQGFSLARYRIRALNAGTKYTMQLDAPSGQTWHVSQKPSWVNVIPSEGNGKTTVTVEIDDMPRTDSTFEIEERNNYYTNHAGRKGEVVFFLDDVGVTYGLDVEQYDSDRREGIFSTIMESNRGSGISIVFIGDGYDAKDIQDGLFENDANQGAAFFFDIEPFRTYRDYFNVYSVTSLSLDSGLATSSAFKDNRFGGFRVDADACLTWVEETCPQVDLSKCLIILLENFSSSGGMTLLYEQGATLSVCPVSKDAYPWDFRGVIQHEAGGHGFGRLAEECIIHEGFFQNCSCHCCSHDDFTPLQTLGYFKNIALSSNANDVPWAHLMFHPQYSDYVDIYEGAYNHARGVYRSEAVSCMNNYIPYFPAICRQAIVERIMTLAGEEFSLEDFYEKDSREDYDRLGI